MAVTLVGFIALRLVVAGLVRRHFVSPLHVSSAPLPGSDFNHAGDWLLGRHTIDGAGHSTSLFKVVSSCRGGSGASVSVVDRCIRAHGFVNTDVFQPASRFWLFQVIESAGFGGLALVLIGVTVWWVRDRLA